MDISNTSKMLAGIILVTVPTIQYGGSFLLGMLRKAETGYVDNALRHDLFRAGHAHAGVMVLLSLICQLLADVAILPTWLIWLARLGAPCAAILMPLGFFVSVGSPRVTEPTRMIRLVDSSYKSAERATAVHNDTSYHTGPVRLDRSVEQPKIVRRSMLKSARAVDCITTPSMQRTLDEWQSATRATRVAL